MEAQKNCNELYYRKFTKTELETDLDFIKLKIQNAHADPYTEITQEEFEKNFAAISSQLVDGMTQREFYQLVKPVFVALNDEHAGLEQYCLPDSILKLQNAAKDPGSGKGIRLAPMEYQKINGFGYLTVNTFDDKSTFPVSVWKVKIDSVFCLIQKDKIQKLVIDVQNNSGGNSEIGDILISYFSDKPYTSYQGKWKKSQEYSDFLKGYGHVDPVYESIPNGEYYPIKAQEIKPALNKNRFKGSTYVVVGKNTFSSAMMFSVIVLDNKLARLVGETPQKGHPNHFGELIVFQTPNTRLGFCFGVKIWIRPSGSYTPKQLIPEKIIDLEGKNERQIIEQL
jgi:hypothetical protein